MIEVGWGGGSPSVLVQHRQCGGSGVASGGGGGGVGAGGGGGGGGGAAGHKGEQGGMHIGDSRMPVVELWLLGCGCLMK
jgi:hypothetical protein